MRRFFRRIRGAFESIIYAGLQPGSQQSQPKRMSWLGPLAKPWERFLSGGPSPTDPLYLTNRTAGSKVKIVAAIGLPCLLVGGLIYAALSDTFRIGSPKPTRDPTPSEVAAKLLPHMDQNITIETNHDVNVMEVRVEPGTPMSLVGSMKNNTDHEIRVAEAVFDITDVAGSQLGAVSTKVENLKARSTATFRFPIKQPEAAFALVREVHAQ